MSPDLAVLAAIVVLLVLLAVRVPVAFALAVAGGVGIMSIASAGVTTSVFGRQAFEAVARYTLIVIPLFILMGVLAKNSQLGVDIFWVVSRALRNVPGGLGIATVAVSAGFAAVSGSSVAAVATVGPMAISEMRRYGYKDTFSSGLVAAGGTLGILIPPSIALVLYGILSGVSIEQLLIAGVVPGVISALIYGVLAFVLGGRAIESEIPVRSNVGVGDRVRDQNPTDGQELPRPLARPSRTVVTDTRLDEVADAGSAPRALRAVSQIGLLFATVVGGLYLGWFTATEAAAMGALVAMVIMMFRLRSAGWRSLRIVAGSFRETVELCGMIFALIVGASIFTVFLTMAGVPRTFANAIVGLQVPGFLVVVLVLAMLIPLGMFLDGFSVLLIMVPLLHPVVAGELGYDGIWFAILVIKTIEIGLITPPVGINAYVVAGTVKGLRPEVVFRGVMPFFIADLATIALLFAWPALVTVLPDLMRN